MVHLHNLKIKVEYVCKWKKPYVSGSPEDFGSIHESSRERENQSTKYLFTSSSRWKERADEMCPSISYSLLKWMGCQI
jgi:hypothetical protein